MNTQPHEIKKEIGSLLEQNTVWEQNTFDVAKYMGQTTMETTADAITVPTSSKYTMADKQTFEDICNKIRIHISQKHENVRESDTSKEKNKWIDMQHDALIGIPEAVKLFKDEIAGYLRENSINISYPEYYDDLVEAIYQETYGLGCVSTWWKHEHHSSSQSCRIIGKNVYFDLPGKDRQKQKFSYDSIEKVSNIAQILRMKNNKARLNQRSPELEIDMNDGTRVTIFIPPRVSKPTIIFRNYTMKRVTLNDWVNYGSIPQELLPVISGLAIARANGLIVGKVRSGKTTFLKALADERFSNDFTDDEVCVVVEKDFHELQLGSHYPDAQIIEFVASGEDLKELFPKLLRSDFTYCIVGEIRSHESEMLMLSCERGSMGALGTYHTLHLYNIPRQIASLICDEYPNRNIVSEIQRVADNVDIIYSLIEMPDGSKKVSRISELRIDSKDMVVTVHDLARYDILDDKWYYTNDISNELLQRMRMINKREADNVYDTLTRLSLENPIMGDHIERSHSLYQSRERND